MLKKKKEIVNESKVNFYDLPLTNIRPQGYLKNEMNLYVDNYINKINSTWDEINSNSYWLGGKGNSSYLALEYIASLIKLAYQLDNEELKLKVKPWVEGILLTIKPNGDFGKEGETDWIEKIYALRVLANYYNVTGDSRVIDFSLKFCKYQYNEIDLLPLTIRTMACLTVEIELLNYFYEQTGKDFFIELKDKLTRYGYDFKEFFTSLPFKNETKTYLSKSNIFFKSNKVKKQVIKESLKDAEKVVKDNKDKATRKYVLSLGNVVALNLSVLLEEGKYTDADYTELTKNYIKQLYENHGLANGCFSSDNHLDGRESNKMTDFETVVYSLKSMLDLERLSADNYYSSYADDIFYNGLLSMFSNDYKVVQGLAGANQVVLGECDTYSMDKKYNMFSEKISNSAIAASSNVFTEFVDSLAYKTDDGFAFCHYAPCCIVTEFKGNRIEIIEKTGYPFNNRADFTINDIDNRQELVLRFNVPKHTSIVVSVNGNQVVSASSGLVVVKKVFTKGDTISIVISNNLRAVFNDDGSLSFRMGGLMLVNPLNASVSVNKKGLLTAEAREDYRKAPIIKDNKLEIRSIQQGNEIVTPFSSKEPMVKVMLNADVVANWGNNATVYDKLPKQAKFQGSSDIITLVPYVNSYCRISQFPYKVLKTVTK